MDRDRVMDRDSVWLGEGEQAAWRTYAMVSRLLANQLERDLQTHGLTVNDYEVMTLIAEAPDRAMRMRDLAHSTLQSKSRLSHQITRMENADLVRRAVQEHDRRGLYAVLTEHGWETLLRAAPCYAAFVRQNFISLVTDEDLAAVTRALTGVMSHLRSTRSQGRPSDTSVAKQPETPLSEPAGAASLSDPRREPPAGHYVRQAKKLEELASDLMAKAAVAERMRDSSWEEIGEALGVTRATAHGRFSKVVNAWEGQRLAAEEDDDPRPSLQELNSTWLRISDLAADQKSPPEQRQPTTSTFSRAGTRPARLADENLVAMRPIASPEGTSTEATKNPEKLDEIIAKLAAVEDRLAQLEQRLSKHDQH